MALIVKTPAIGNGIGIALTTSYCSVTSDAELQAHLYTLLNE